MASGTPEGGEGAHAELEQRLQALQEQVDREGAEALVAQIEQQAEGTALHARALLLAAQRAYEDQRLQSFLSDALLGLNVARGVGDAYLNHHAEMAVAGARISVGELEEGLATLDRLAPGPSFRELMALQRQLRPAQGSVNATHRHVSCDEPVAQATADFVSRLVGAGGIAVFARDATAVWALGGMAEQHQRAGNAAVAGLLWDTFERWLGALVRENPDSLQTVYDIASQRGYTEVVTRARASEARGGTPPQTVQTSPLERSIHAWIDALVTEGSLELEDDEPAVRAGIAEEVLRVLEDAEGEPDLAEQLASALVEADGVDDLYLSDDDLMASLRRVLQG